MWSKCILRKSKPVFGEIMICFTVTGQYFHFNSTTDAHTPCSLNLNKDAKISSNPITAGYLFNLIKYSTCHEIPAGVGQASVLYTYHNSITNAFTQSAWNKPSKSSSSKEVTFIQK